MRRKSTVVHDFYCTNCGKKGIPLARTKSLQHGKFHRKKLYCIYCKETVNMVECRTDEEVYDFKEQFEKGAFKDEAEVSLNHCRSSGIG